MFWTLMLTYGMFFGTFLWLLLFFYCDITDDTMMIDVHNTRENFSLF